MPGDATSYFVILHRLSMIEAHHVEGVEPNDVLFGLAAASNPTPVHAFRADGYLDLDYYTEKIDVLGRMNKVTIVTGLIVLGYLTGREIGGIPRLLAGIGSDWLPDWRLQLDPLVSD